MIYNFSDADQEPNDQFDSPSKIKQGLVLWGTKNIYKVIPCKHDSGEADFSAQEIECRIKGKRGLETTEGTFLLAGDYVKYTDTEAGYGMIVARVARKNSILRRKQDSLHPIAVNIDLLLIIASLETPPFRPRFIDRMIYVAKCEGVPILLVLNKLDLCVSPSDVSSISYDEAIAQLSNSIQSRIASYKDIDIELIYSSTQKLWGITEIEKKIAHKNVAVVGQSGVGKSSIINAIAPEFKRKVGAVSTKYKRGRQVTTRPEFLRNANFRLIDTPGIRELFPNQSDLTSLIDGYPDIYRFSYLCKLPSCTHRTEPECAVKQHIGKEIHEDRYESYLRLRKTIEDFEQNKWTRNKR